MKRSGGFPAMRRRRTGSTGRSELANEGGNGGGRDRTRRRWTGASRENLDVVESEGPLRPERWGETSQAANGGASLAGSI